MVISDEKIVSFNMTSVKATNVFEAESAALNLGVETSRELGEQIEAYVDNEPLYEVLTGVRKARKKVKDTIAPLKKFSHVDYVWKPREENKVADALSAYAARYK